MGAIQPKDAFKEIEQQLCDSGVGVDDVGLHDVWLHFRLQAYEQ